MKSLRPTIALALLLALLTSSVVRAQVGGAPAPPPSLWNFLGIPQGIQKLRGATSNRRGNHPGREPKPPLKAIADPKNLESKDKAIKKAAEVKQAEDLKKQKIKAVKYLTKIGCGCYDIDGGVTEALVASAGDCTEDVRYETIQAIADAAEGECCSKCGKVCCCNKEVLMKLASMAYDRDDSGCYIEPSERVREAAAEALEICCPNDTSPVIVEERKEEEAPEPERSDDVEEVAAPESESDSEVLPELDSGEELPVDDTVTRYFFRRSNVRDFPANNVGDQEGDLHSGVVLHVSHSHQLAHIRFGDAGVQPPVGSMVIAYRIDDDNSEPVALAKLHVVESSPGIANVTGSKDALLRITRGNLVVCPTAGHLTTYQQLRSQKPTAASQPIEIVTDQPPANPFAGPFTEVRQQATPVAIIKPLFSNSLPKVFQPASLAIASAPAPSGLARVVREIGVGQVQHTALKQPGSILPDDRLMR